ncbi:MAG: carbohydrate ABC transporter permease [Treponema sp.]|jgi:raffinose/stachyose/melibiose transport system permease protein|nr:carbohydrate ABC transporter permease [Treponema sp.]
MMNKPQARRIPVYFFTGLFAALWAAISLMPFYLMIITSFKSAPDYGKNGFFSFPLQFMFANYVRVIRDGLFNYFKNSLVVVSAALFLLLLLSLCAAYPLSRFQYGLRRPMNSFIVASMAIPMHVTLIPIYLLTRAMGLYDKLPGLVIPYIAFNAPITVFILVNFLKTIPSELEDAAEIDGCNKMGVFKHVIVPLSGSGVVTVAIYDAITMWNEFSFALVLMQSKRMLTLPLAVWNYKGQYSASVPLLFCVLVMSVLPMIIAYAIFQDKLVQGMMAGAVKG